MSQPNFLRELPAFQAIIQSENLKKTKKEPKGQFSRQLQTQLDAIAALDLLHKENLKCFERFSTEPRPDFIETLLCTSRLGATNQRDHIYGISGMTGYPAKAMSIHDWMIAGKQEVSILIDYSASLTSILCALTWLLLMKGGLGLLTRFKAFASDDDGTSEQPLPSWVIDWRLSAKYLRLGMRDITYSGHTTAHRIDEAWHVFLNTEPGSRLVPSPPPIEH
ncbi:hypothetical protein BCR34DRAFT_312208 [Clohesyomyces aquaticus]|uniref:Uncharacterized protein n=1 Tax=Clohesyomyces aquaticus TaxID=1231657 RepID=A0A1Y1ZQ01_9PLEO|nr:hypothetical protein BCR34DRAFT_312208 [Clohesyomyces aquaticus]